MVTGNEFREFFAKQLVKRFTFLSSFIGFFGAIITSLAGEEWYVVIIFLLIGFIFAILRCVAET